MREKGGTSHNTPLTRLSSPEDRASKCFTRLSVSMKFIGTAWILTWIRLPDLTNKNTGHLIKLGFKINNE